MTFEFTASSEFLSEYYPQDSTYGYRLDLSECFCYCTDIGTLCLFCSTALLPYVYKLLPLDSALLFLCYGTTCFI